MELNYLNNYKISPISFIENEKTYKSLNLMDLIVVIITLYSIAIRLKKLYIFFVRFYLVINEIT